MFCFRRIFRVNEDPKELMTKFGLAAFKKLIGKPWLNHSNLIQSKFGLYVEYVVPVLGHGHHGHAMSCHFMPLKTRPPTAGLLYYCALRRGLHVNWLGRRWSEPNWLKQGQGPAKQTSPDRWRRLPPPNFQQGPLHAGTLTLTTDCAICSDSVCHGQDQYSVLGLLPRHWTNKIKTETDHLQIRLCKHLTLCACPAHRKKAAIGFKPIKLLARSRQRVGH